MDLEKFNPTVADLTALVEKTKAITVTDLKDKAQLALVRASRIELKKARVTIEKAGKSYREEAVAFQKKVIAKEKELIAIVEPEEARLTKIEDEAEQIAAKEVLEAKWPERLARLYTIKGGGWDKSLKFVSDEEFESSFNKLVAMKNEDDRRALELEKSRVAEEAAKVERERETQEREKKAREDERAKAERDAKDAAVRAEREKAEAVERAKRDAEDEARRKQQTIDEAIAAEKRLQDEAAARKERELAEEVARKAREIKEAQEREKQKQEAARLEQEELESKKKYQTFLEKNGWTEETKNDFIIQWSGPVCTLYKKVGSVKVK